MTYSYKYIESQGTHTADPQKIALESIMSNHFFGGFYPPSIFLVGKAHIYMYQHLYLPTSLCLVGYSNLYIYIHLYTHIYIYIMYTYTHIYIYVLLYYYYIIIIRSLLYCYLYIHYIICIYVCWFPTPQGLVSRHLDPDSWNELLASVGASNEEATRFFSCWPWKLVP